MKNTTIRKGTHITTLLGEIVIKDFNGSIVYADNYESDGDGNYTFIREDRLTLNEIGKMMKELDGKNHTVIFESGEE